jgi:hypothetical protein
MYGNHATITCIDNWSQFGGPRNTFLHNVAKYKHHSTAFQLIDSDFRHIDYTDIGKYNVYLFDGPNTDGALFDGTVIARDALDSEYVFVVDDWNWSHTRAGTLSGLDDSALDVVFAIEIQTSQDGTHPDIKGENSDWHNGYYFAVIRQSGLKSNSIRSPRFKGVASTRGVMASTIATPQISLFTPEQVKTLTTHGIGINKLLIASFRPEPRSRPTFHIGDPAQPSPMRLKNSLDYINTLISEFITNPDYYYMHSCDILSNNNQLFCILSIDDRPPDILKTIGYCGLGYNMTLIPDVHFWMYRGYFEQRRKFTEAWVPWRGRVPQVFWRGSTTGAAAITLESLADLPRFRLCSAGNRNDTLRAVLDAKFTEVTQATSAPEATKIAGHLDNLGLLSPYIAQTEFIKYRFQIDMDGNSNSWSFLLKLMMGSCVLKVGSPWRQWYYNDLQPWVHYVPVEADLADLEERIQWCLDSDEAVQKIADNGMKYASGKVFGTEMMQASKSILKASRTSTEWMMQ